MLCLHASVCSNEVSNTESAQHATTLTGAGGAPPADAGVVALDFCRSKVTAACEHSKGQMS